MPDWVSSLTVIQVAAPWLGLAAGVMAVVKIVRMVGPTWRQISQFLLDWNGESERPGVSARPGVMETLASHTQQIKELSVSVGSLVPDDAITTRLQMLDHKVDTFDSHLSKVEETLAESVAELEEVKTGQHILMNAFQKNDISHSGKGICPSIQP